MLSIPIFLTTGGMASVAGACARPPVIARSGAVSVVHGKKERKRRDGDSKSLYERCATKHLWLELPGSFLHPRENRHLGPRRMSSRKVKLGHQWIGRG